MFYVSDRFLRKDRVHGFPDLLLKFFFLEKNIAGKNKADGYVHSGAKESHGDGHCRRNNVIYATLEHTEYRIDHFTRINIKGLRPFNNFRIVSESIVYPFLKNGDVFFNLFADTYEGCSQFRHYYQHNDHKYAKYKADGQHKTDRT